jgi:hypothetical protein
LEILEELSGINPRGVVASSFARKMWPESAKRYGKCGRSGVTRGTGVNQKAGGFLNSLDSKGWVYKRWSGTIFLFLITDAGRRLLAEVRNNIPTAKETA